MRAVIAPQNQGKLDHLIADQQNPNSPEYHRWLAPGEFTELFGPTSDQLTQVSNWLALQGFTVTSASAPDRAVWFTGPVSLVTTAFKVRLVGASDGKHFGNLDAPALPSELVGLIQSIRGLDNLHALAVRPRPAVLINKTQHAFGPPDLYSFYDENTLPNENINGASADCIALVEYSDYDNASIDAFDNFFSLPAPDLTTVTVDGSGSFDSFAELEISRWHIPVAVSEEIPSTASPRSLCVASEPAREMLGTKIARRTPESENPLISILRLDCDAATLVSRVDTIFVPFILTYRSSGSI